MEQKLQPQWWTGLIQNRQGRARVEHGAESSGPTGALFITARVRQQIEEGLVSTFRGCVA